MKQLPVSSQREEVITSINNSSVSQSTNFTGLQATPIDFPRLKIDTTEPPIGEEVELSNPADIYQSDSPVVVSTTVFISSVPICVRILDL